MAQKKSDLPTVVSSMIRLLQSLRDDEERQRTLAAAAAAFNIEFGATKSSVSEPSLDAQDGDEGQSVKDDPTKFIRAKKPKNDRELVACLGYFLAKVRGTSTFGSKDLENLNDEADGNMIGEFPIALNNATGYNMYFKAAGKGKKKMSPHGNQVVEALPDQDAVKKIVNSFRKKSRKRGNQKKRGKKKKA